MSTVSNTVVVSGSVAGPNLQQELQKQLRSIGSSYDDLFNIVNVKGPKGSTAALFEAYGLPPSRKEDSNTDLRQARGTLYGYRDELTSRLSGHLEQVNNFHLDSAVTAADTWIANTSSAISTVNSGTATANQAVNSITDSVQLDGTSA